METPRVALPAAPAAPAMAERPTIDVLLRIWRGRWIVLGCIVASFIGGLLYLHRAVNVYSSSALLYVQQAVPSVVGEPLATTGDPGYLYAQCQIIHSTAILSKALQVPGVSKAQCLQGLTDPVSFLKSSVNPVPDSRGDLIFIIMESTNAEDSSLIVNGVVQAYIDYQKSQHQSTAVEVLGLLQNEQRQREADLQNIEQQMADFRKNNPALALEVDKGGKIVTNAFGSLSEALTEAQMRTLDLGVAVGEAHNFQNDPIQLKRIVDRVDGGQGLQVSESAFDPGLIEACREAHTAYLLELAATGPQNPEVQNALQRYNFLADELKQQNERAATTYMSYLQGELQAASQREAALSDAVNTERTKAINLNSTSAQYEELDEQKQTTERALDMLDNRMTQVNMTADAGDLTVSPLELAKPDFTPVRPKRSQTMGMALVIGLMMGLGGAMLREMLEQRLRSAEEISNLLSLPVLGSVPTIILKGSALVPSWSQQERVSERLLNECGQVMHLQPRSDVAEAFRTIRTAIYFGMSGRPAKTILITSPSRGDGKSTMTSNLAIAIAQSGRRVLLIDADCRSPMQHRIFGVGNDGPGLSTVLLGKASLKDATQKTRFEKVHLMASGQPTHSPSELLDSHALVDLLSEASELYDQVLIDSPPLVPISDARILAASCGATILVLRAGKSTRRAADDALDALTSVGAPVLGIVVNDLARQRNGRYYHYYPYPAASPATGWNPRGEERHGNGNGNGGNGHGQRRLSAGSTIETQSSLEEDSV
jgi:polysaccharide biosynthesis transport protein